MVHNDYKEMLPARSLAALDSADDRVLSDHLETCAECRRELDEWNAVAAALALSAPAQEPSPEVREQILSSIAKEETSPSTPRVVPFNAPAKNAWSSLGSFGAIAAALFFVAMMAAVFMLWRENRSMQTQLSQQATQMHELEQKVAQDRRIMQQFTAPGARTAELVPTSAAPGAKAMIAIDQKGGHAILLARGLPEAPPGKAYQIWYIVDNKPLPGRTFKMDSTGHGMLEDDLPASALKAAVFAITMESESGASTPTSAILLSSSL